MNSYIIPTANDIDPTNYQELKYNLKKNSDGSYVLEKDTSKWYKSFHIMSSYVWFAVTALVFLVVRYFGVKRKNSNFWEAIRLVFDSIWSIFEGILWVSTQHRIKTYVVGLFFIVLVSNLLSVVNDIIRFFLPQSLRWFTAPTAEFETALALAIIATLVPLWLQLKRLGLFSFLHEYVPVSGKWLIEGRGILARIGDSVVSLFVWFLDIVGIFSKIVSLSMRLFGNMSSGSILLNVMFLGLGWIFVGLIGMNLVIWIPLIVYIQGLLVAVVQAFVFSMLVSIGIKLSLE